MDGTVPGMERLPHLVGYPRGLALGEHPDIPHATALALAGEDGWLDVHHGPKGSLVQRRMLARRIIRAGDGVIVRRAFGPRHVAIAVAVAVAAAAVGAAWS